MRLLRVTQKSTISKSTTRAPGAPTTFCYCSASIVSREFTTSNSNATPNNDSTDSIQTRIRSSVRLQPQDKNLPRYYKYLRLKTYRPEELDRRFQDIVQSSNSEDSQQRHHDGLLTSDNLQPYILERIREIEDEQKLQQSTLTAAAETFDNKDDDDKDEQALLLSETKQMYARSEANQFLRLFPSYQAATSSDSSSVKYVSRQDFIQVMQQLASKVDYQKTTPIISSMLLVGLSVGILSPAMPFIVQELELTSSQFGLVVSAFGLAKMMGNVPSAIAVERHGRKPYMTYSLGLISVGVAGIGISSSFEELYVCRLLTGFGVAALSTGGTMMMTDVSTPLNRATTIAPIMSAFSAGTALGPALGGLLVDTVGLHSTFYLTGGCFMGVATLNRVIMEETKPKPIVFPWQQKEAQRHGDSLEKSNESILKATQKALGQWSPLLKRPKMRSVLIMNAMYWVALAGAQMTLLPLILTDPNNMAMSATQVGQVYAAMSLVHIFGNPVFARVADQVGKAPAILTGCALVSISMAGLSTYCETYSSLGVALGVWAVGSSMLSTAPVAYVSDKVSDGERAQALALLRTCGDVGFLVGASATGALADYIGLHGAMQCSASVLATATMWFATRHDIFRRSSALINKVK